MKKLLIISPCAFHNKVGQAGHKTLNFYVSKFSVNFDVTVLSLADYWKKDFELMIQDHPNVQFIANRKKKNILQRLRDSLLMHKIYPFVKMFNPIYYLSNGLNKRRLHYLLKKIDNPEQLNYVLVEFTSMIFQYNVIQSYFPHAKFIASCHDVSFLSVERWLNSNKVWMSKKNYYQSFKELEIKALNQYDLVVPHNVKDAELLRREVSFSSEKLHVINPYFDRYTVKATNPDGIVFFGAMKRKENLDSLYWFLQNVWKEVSESHQPDLKLYVVGGGDTDSLKLICEKYKNVVVTGFVLDPTPYFNKSFAMVVPLQYGAGIKVKSIEALAAGIPLISNQIGIEGIPATKGSDYLHCEKPAEWIDSILEITENRELFLLLSQNGKKLTDEKFNLEKSYQDYKSRINSL